MAPGRKAEATESTTTPQPLCAKESLDLLNCVAGEPFDREKCLRFLDALRACVLEKKVKKFSLAETNHHGEGHTSKDKQ